MRFGLIGCGEIGALRAEAISQLDGARLIAVADSDPRRLSSVAAGHGAAAVSDWRALVGRDDVEAVIVSTPPPFHAEMTVAALESGKHVLCEKPLGRNPEECELMVECAGRTGRLLATGFNLRFYPMIRKAREIVDSGAIGELDHVRSYAGHPGGSEFTHPWVHDASVTGGGALVDNGIHIIDLTRYFLGKVCEVSGFRTHAVWNFPDCEDNGFALMRNAAGNVASLQASWSDWSGYRFWVEVYGTKGCVRASYPPMLVRTALVEDAGKPPRRSMHVFPWLQVMERIRSFRWTALRSLTDELDAFRRSVRGEKTALALGADGLEAVQIAHAVYRSSSDGGAIRIGR